MRPGGILLTLAGVWVLCQVLGGRALERLGVIAAAPVEEPAERPGAGLKDHFGRPL